MLAVRPPALVLAFLGVCLSACFNDGGAPALTTEPGTTDASVGPTTTDIGTTTAATTATSTGEASTTTTDGATTDGATTDATTAAATSTGCVLETWYFDIDKDGYGGSTSTEKCGAPGAGYTKEPLDCDDSKPAVNPGAAEVCDKIDNDCDDGIDEYPAGAMATCNGCRTIVGPSSLYYFCDTPEREWDPARTHCKTLLGDLAIINTVEEHLYLNDQLAGPASRFWIGLGDSANEGQFVWVDGSAVDPKLDMNVWAQGEPNDMDNDVVGPADCVALTDGLIGDWYDEACGDLHGLICEAPLPI